MAKKIKIYFMCLFLVLCFFGLPTKTVAIACVPDEDCLIELPEIVGFEEEKDVTPDNETKAGDEEMATPEPAQNNTTTSVTDVPAQTPVRLAQANTNQNQPTEPDAENGEVLQAQNTESQDNQPIEVEKEDQIKQDQEFKTVKDPNVYKWYGLAGLVVFVGLVTFLLMAMKKQKR